VVREGSTFQMKETEKITVRAHPDLNFHLDKFEVHGRLEDGQVPVEMREEDVLIEPVPGPKSGAMLAAVLPLVDAATASGADMGQTFPRLLAFNLFGQGVAFFESAHTLINDHQPVEALPALRGLAIIAARFEQITDDCGPGIGIAVRMALDAASEFGADAAHTARYCQELLNGASSAGVVVPAKLAGPETSAVYVSLTLEMQLAQNAVNGTYVAARTLSIWGSTRGSSPGRSRRWSPPPASLPSSTYSSGRPGCSAGLSTKRGSTTCWRKRGS
jgi:hypothetical protein